MPRYDVTGGGYSATRSENPRIARAIWEALDGCRSGISVFHRLDSDYVAEAIVQLGEDLASGSGASATQICWIWRNSTSVFFSSFGLHAKSV